MDQTPVVHQSRRLKRLQKRATSTMGVNVLGELISIFKPQHQLLVEEARRRDRRYNLRRRMILVVMRTRAV